ncbi:helix-turn-helix transcriptional regulator [Nonomuraea sp. NPDC005650]|uniref:helix-turn-helix transcriptional regulator n=1 Tax=Nonomuraea sp. NPDC005650 TaxID=3157045 RepID=UPI0033AAB20E
MAGEDEGVSEQDIRGAWMTEELKRHGYVISPGTLYPTLHRLEAGGYIGPPRRVCQRWQRTAGHCWSRRVRCCPPPTGHWGPLGPERGWPPQCGHAPSVLGSPPAPGGVIRGV